MRIFVEGILNFVQEPRTDDAATLPDASRFTQVEIIVKLLRGPTQQCHPLGIGANLRAIEGVSHHVDEGFQVTINLRDARATQLLRGRDPFGFDRGHDPSIHRRNDRGNADPQVQRGLHGPLSRALLLCRIQHHIHQRLVGFAVNLAENVSGDFNQE